MSKHKWLSSKRTWCNAQSRSFPKCQLIIGSSSHTMTHDSTKTQLSKLPPKLQRLLVGLEASLMKPALHNEAQWWESVDWLRPRFSLRLWSLFWGHVSVHPLLLPAFQHACLNSSSLSTISQERETEAQRASWCSFSSMENPTNCNIKEVTWLAVQFLERWSHALVMPHGW